MSSTRSGPDAEMIRQITQGATVYDDNGDKVGKVLQVDPSQGYFVAEKGWLFTEDVYIPLAAVSRADADSVYLRYSKQDLKNQNWTQPPTTAAYSGQATAGNAASAMSQTTQTGATETRVPLREEELVVGKQQQEAGQVHLHKDVIEQQQNVNVPVSHEEVHVDVAPATPGTQAPEDAFVERDIDVPVMSEEVVTGKRVKAGEEARIHKHTVTENQQVGDTVRKERLRVEGDDNIDVQRDTSPTDETTANP